RSPSCSPRTSARHRHRRSPRPRLDLDPPCRDPRAQPPAPSHAPSHAGGPAPCLPRHRAQRRSIQTTPPLTAPLPRRLRRPHVSPGHGERAREGRRKEEGGVAVVGSPAALDRCMGAELLLGARRSREGLGCEAAGLCRDGTAPSTFEECAETSARSAGLALQHVVWYFLTASIQQPQLN
uniref:Uncharacterized protein n=1 Tax=Triticum urartu TaxID=4572 RepID=A0A8R7UVP8_TRIUA